MARALMLRARWLWAGEGRLFEDGALALADGAIVACGARGEVARRVGGAAHTLDLGDAVICPGLVNAHTHLELTDLADGIPTDTDFPKWLAAVGTKRLLWTPGRYVRSARRGVALSLAAGTTRVGEISTSWRSGRAVGEGGLGGVVFLETMGWRGRPGRKVRALERALSSRRRGSGDALAFGLSPHAPYSTSPGIYRGVLALARRRGAILSTHLAECAEEVEFVRDGTGNFRRFLDRFRLLPRGFRAPGMTPVEYAHSLGLLEAPVVLAHVNYVEESDIELLRAPGVCVVYCPRTHARFGHPAHPAPRMLAAGVRVALGTDSLAGTPTLSVLDEMRFVHASGLGIAPEMILKMATENGARALGDAGPLAGRLDTGARADIIVFGFRETPRDPVAGLVEETGNIVLVIAAAVARHDPGGILAGWRET